VADESAGEIMELHILIFTTSLLDSSRSITN
jgi:hypothetical protein